MEADAKVRQARIEEQVLTDYVAAQMRVMAGAGKLGSLDRWVEQVRPSKPRSVRDMILALQDAAARGAPITIRKVEG
jgi:hypothetical protein